LKEDNPLLLKKEGDVIDLNDFEIFLQKKNLSYLLDPLIKQIKDEKNERIKLHLTQCAAYFAGVLSKKSKNEILAIKTRLKILKIVLSGPR
jgi:hypothetical protein